jgi:hypothetical protein
MNLSTAARRLLLASPLFAASRNVAAFSSRKYLPSAVSAFGGHRALKTTTTTRAFTSSTPLHMANVQKLIDPQSELLDTVDVFIFDCDGVIWRVRMIYDLL